MNAKDRMVKWLEENQIKTWEEAARDAGREYMYAMHIKAYEEAKIWDMRAQFFFRMIDEKRPFPCW